MKHLLSLLEYNESEFVKVLDLAEKTKADWAKGKRPDLLPRKVLGLIFEKPSLRTRVSFEAAMMQMGGNSIFLGTSDGKIGVRETVADFSRTISHYVDAVVLRTFSHETVLEFAKNSTVPVINGLSDQFHPCQSVADILTIREAFGPKPGKTVVFVGDGNNVSRSLAIACALAGYHFILTGPKPYHFDTNFTNLFSKRFPKADLIQSTDANDSVKNADILYTDVWTSMGQESENEKRIKKFKDFQINDRLINKAPKHCKFMHCLPAHRGEEVTGSVIDGKASLVFEQAGNRMHAQKAILLDMILNSKK
ncbi:MAG: ornithine carbamoyltransferase [Planctomycetes bacterium]|nr:ornithine carbamoyltransferase [Planctomycetota bacterium]NBY00787.1 ornithine carbamoyltransferase [Planctomycetota bacterium]